MAKAGCIEASCISAINGGIIIPSTTCPDLSESK